MDIAGYNKAYETDGSFVFSCNYHVIFCPKYRRRVLVGDTEKRLKELILAKQDEYRYKVLDLEVMPDHVHMVLAVNPKVGIYTVVSKIKGYTSHELREQFPSLKTRLPTLWTTSRFISSVGAVTLEAVKKYIEGQKGQ